jgi:hypothetical protein
VRLVLFNVPFAVAIWLMGDLPEIIQTVVVGTIIFLVPGAAWIDQSRGDAVMVLFRIVIASLLISVLAWLVVLIPQGPTNRYAFIALLTAITNVGLWFGSRRGWYRAKQFSTPLSRSVLLVGALFYLQTYLGAAHFVPALEDQDMETQGTAYGLINTVAPTMATNRGMTFFFAHPLLLHFWIAESAFISGDLERLRYYHESALAVRSTPDLVEDRWKQDFERFLADPVLVPTRLPNLFLSVFLLFPLAFLVHGMTGSRAAAIGACALYVTLPEVYVRSSYGGYMAITNWLTMCGVYFYLQSSRVLPNSSTGTVDGNLGSLRAAAVAAFLGSWADQKAVLLPMATAAHAVASTLLGAGLRFWRGLWARPEILSAFAVGLAFCAGWATFGLYGISVSATDFFNDHIRWHVVDRLSMANVNLAAVDEGAWVYPSIVALWQEFLSHIGWFYALPAALAIVHAARNPRRADGMLLLWFAIGAIGFSLVDWRQTKHLAHLLPPLAALIAVFWASRQGTTRAIFSLLLGAGLVWNVWRIGQLMLDFEYIEPSPIW